jgi:hypothetical protein
METPGHTLPKLEDLQLDDGPEQIEYNLGPGTAPTHASVMTGAVDAALRSFTRPGEEKPSPEVVAEARVRAEKLIDDLSADGAEGVRDAYNLILSMGLPATRMTFQYMLKAAGLTGSERANVRRQIAGFSPVTEHGCHRIEFHDRSTGKGSVAYLVIDRCPANHNLDVQLGKLKDRVAPEQWSEVFRSLSMLVFHTRSVYAQIAKHHAKLVLQLAGPSKAAEYSSLKVDPANTTLFVNPAWPNRVGIYVRFEEEAQAQAQAKTAK